MYQNEFTIKQEYRAKGYTFVGSVNTNPKAYDAYQKSNNKESIEIGRCLHLVILHDLKAMVEIDSGD